MARLLVTSDNSWYEELALIASYYESEFQRTIKQHVTKVFPDYFVLDFTMNVYSNSKGPKKPDMVMVSKDCSDWWIIELELSSHTLNHVEEQVEVFVNGDYNAYEVSEYIIKKSKNLYINFLPQKKLSKLIQLKQPNVLVIVDEPKNKWEKALNSLGARLCVFQVYKNTNGTEAYRLDGIYPDIQQKESHCNYHKSIPNLLEVLSPDLLEIEDDEIQISFNNKLTTWKKIFLENKVYLKSIGSINPVPANNNYVLYIDSNNRFILKIN